MTGEDLGARDGQRFAMTVENRTWLASVAFELFCKHLEERRLVNSDAVEYGNAFLIAAASKGEGYPF